LIVFIVARAVIEPISTIVAGQGETVGQGYLDVRIMIY